MNNVDNDRYQKKVEAQEVEHEALCRRCGECCGAFGSDPCSRLLPTGDGHYACGTYTDRLGPQKTRSGVIFTCVTMRDVHKHGVYYNNCGYNKGA